MEGELKRSRLPSLTAGGIESFPPHQRRRWAVPPFYWRTATIVVRCFLLSSLPPPQFTGSQSPACLACLSLALTFTIGTSVYYIVQSDLLLAQRLTHSSSRPICSCAAAAHGYPPCCAVNLRAPSSPNIAHILLPSLKDKMTLTQFLPSRLGLSVRCSPTRPISPPLPQ